MNAKIVVELHGALEETPSVVEDWLENTDVMDVSLADRVHIVERVAELHARRVQAGLLALPVFVAAR